MRYLALACDYDGTLAHNGRVSPETLAALERLLASGRRLIMVTGRRLDELLEIFPEIGLFAWVVAENGGLLYRPSTKELRPLADVPKPEFVARLAECGVSPVATGATIVATWEPHEQTVLEVIRSLGLELQVIFNKGAVMVLPAGVNKASGLTAALEQMGLSRHNVVGVGDAENDHAFLEACEFSAAVANALDSVKHSADCTTAGARGDGVAELIERMLADDLAELSQSVRRHDLLLGAASEEQPLGVEPFGRTLLITGASGSGKSTAATALLERMADHGYQFCILDPEGDYETFEKAVVLGASDRAPKVEEVLHALSRPSQSVVVNLIGLPISDRPNVFAELAPRLLEMRVRTGRPHWIVLDETHHLAPVAWAPAEQAVPSGMSETMLITVHPDQVSPRLLQSVNALVAVGAAAAGSVRQFCQALGKRAPDLPIDPLEAGHVLYWRGDSDPEVVALAPGRTERRRHSRKYAEGVLPPDRSFYFRGPGGKLKLRAQNLLVFLQMAEGVDDDTWLYHLRRGDYSLWFADRIKDDDLAAEARQVEAAEELGAARSRQLIKAAIERRYTLPAASPVPAPGTDAEARWS